MTEIKVDANLSKPLDQIARDIGIGYAQNQDGEIINTRLEFLRRAYAQRREQNKTYWWINIYIAGCVIAGIYLAYSLFTEILKYV